MQSGCQYICKKLRPARAVLITLPPLVYTAIPEGSRSEFFFPGTTASFYALIIATEYFGLLRKTNDNVVDGTTLLTLTAGFIELFSGNFLTGILLVAASNMYNRFHQDQHQPDNGMSFIESLVSLLVGSGTIFGWIYILHIMKNDRLFNNINQNQQCLPNHNPIGFFQQLEYCVNNELDDKQLENDEISNLYEHLTAG